MPYNAIRRKTLKFYEKNVVFRRPSPSRPFAYFNAANILPSTLYVTTSYVAVYLTFQRSPYYALSLFAVPEKRASRLFFSSSKCVKMQRGVLLISILLIPHNTRANTFPLFLSPTDIADSRPYTDRRRRRGSFAPRRPKIPSPSPYPQVPL